MKAWRSSGDCPTKGFTALLFAVCFLPANAIAQQNRITNAIDNLQRITLHGHVHPKARIDNDRGRISPSLGLSYVTLALAQSESQQADLDKLLSEQQTPGSPNHHRWLAPEEYAQRFGASDEDLSKITAWLQGQGLTIAAIARGRNWIAVKMARPTSPTRPNPRCLLRSQAW